jgi:hypothetical protein
VVRPAHIIGPASCEEMLSGIGKTNCWWTHGSVMSSLLERRFVFCYPSLACRCGPRSPSMVLCRCLDRQYG